MSTVVVSARGEDRVRSGRPWIYRSNIRDVDAEPGAIVRVLGPAHRTLGSALFSDRSQITLRMLTRGETMADPALVRERIGRAVAYRRSLALDATAYRLVHGEADLLPSLVVDRYGEYIVVQALSQGMDRLLLTITSLLTELLAPKGILARNDPRIRELEGLDRRVELLAGEVPDSVGVTELGIDYDV